MYSKQKETLLRINATIQHTRVLYPVDYPTTEPGRHCIHKMSC